MFSTLCPASVIRLTLAALLTSAISAPAIASGPITLARNGKTNYSIVVSKDAIEPEKTAANELQYYLKLVTGADFQIINESKAKVGSPQILVGPSNRLKKFAQGIDWGALGQDGVVIRTAGKNLLLAGGRPRGTLYAVYSFLEDTVGCRWWAANENTIPSKSILQIPELNENYTPKLRYREAFYRDVLKDSTFAAKLKLNGHFENIDAKYGGHYKLLGWCHTFYQLLPPDKYFAQHPEWYSEINGKRTASGAQLCLTNEEMKKELVRAALEWIKKDPTAGIISITQNDCHGNCQCAKCKAIEQEEGSPSGLLIRFVNSVAEEIQKEYPDMLIETLAYQYTRKPPMHVKPRQNVVVRLCSIECNFAQPLESDSNKTFRDDIRAWSAISPNLYIWDYVTDFSSYIQPQPNMRVLAPNIRFFEKNKAIGIFEQGDACCSVGDFVRLRAWLLAHLLWDSSRDEKKLTEEFLNGYYGAAGPYLKQYLDLVHDAVERKGMNLPCYNKDLSFLTPRDMAQAVRLFDKAAQAVLKDPVLSKRVRRERLPLDHVWLKCYDELKQQSQAENVPFAGPKDPTAACEEFIKLALEWDAGNYSESQSFESYIPGLEAQFSPTPPTPDELSKLPASKCIVVGAADFKLANAPEWVRIVDDPKADGGKVALMPANHTQWAVQYHIPESFAAKHPGHWRVYLVARCDGAKKGTAFSYGVYNNNSGGAIVTNTANLGLFSDGSYHTIYLGSHKPMNGMYIWAAPTGNANTVKGVYINRVVFVKDKD